MTRKRHIYGINFILWLSFIAFAAVIIFLTWIFQTMLLRVFFGADMTEELTSVGDKAYGDIGFLMGIPDHFSSGTATIPPPAPNSPLQMPHTRSPTWTKRSRTGANLRAA